MTTWKKALVLGSLGAGAILFITRRGPAAVVATTVGLVVLAAEYPEKFETVWDHAPDYVTRGVQIFQTITQIAERFAEQAAQRSAAAYHEIGPDYGD